MRLGTTGLGRFILGRRGIDRNGESTGPFPGHTAVVTILTPTDTSVTGYLKQAKLARNITTKDVSGINNRARTYIASVHGATFTVQGNFDATYDGYLNSIVGSISGFSYAPAGIGAGRIKYTSAADLTAYEISSPKDDIVSMTATFQTSATLTREVLA